MRGVMGELCPFDFLDRGEGPAHAARMKQLGIALVCMVSAALAGCQRDDSAMREELAQIKTDVAEIKDLVKQGGGRGAAGAARPQRPRRPRPDPKAVYSVPIEGAPYKGAKDAKVTVVKAFEFACPFCERARPTMDQLLEDYEGDIKVVYKHFLVHPQQATLPAQAACAAGEQGKFAEMEDLLWEKAYKTRDFGEENMEKLAKEAGLDLAKFKADMKGICQKKVRQDHAQVAAVGTTGTPAFYINGRFLSGARPVDQFKVIVDEELKKANERIGKNGISAANYYEEFVVKKGLDKLSAK